jgi:hypothetical protein
MKRHDTQLEAGSLALKKVAIYICVVTLPLIT